MARRIDAYISAANPGNDKGVDDNDSGKHCRRWLRRSFGRRREGFADMMMTTATTRSDMNGVTTMGK